MSIRSRPHWCAVALLVVAACSSPAPLNRYAFADPAMIHAALYFWQEGPTDGRVCLEPYLLSNDTLRTAEEAEWADTVLTAVLGDTLIALDSTRAMPWARHDSTVRADRGSSTHLGRPTRQSPRQCRNAVGRLGAADAGRASASLPEHGCVSASRLPMEDGGRFCSSLPSTSKNSVDRCVSRRSQRSPWSIAGPREGVSS